MLRWAAHCAQAPLSYFLGERTRVFYTIRGTWSPSTTRLGATAVADLYGERVFDLTVQDAATAAILRPWDDLPPTSPTNPVVAVFRPLKARVCYCIDGRELSNGVELIELEAERGRSVKAITVDMLRHRVAEVTRTHPYCITIHPAAAASEKAGTGSSAATSPRGPSAASTTWTVWTALGDALPLDGALPASTRVAPLIVRVTLSPEKEATSAAFTATSRSSLEADEAGEPRQRRRLEEPREQLPAEFHRRTRRQRSRSLETLYEKVIMDANADAPPPLQEILRDGFTEDRNGVIAGCFEVFTYRHSSHSTWNQDTTVDVLQIGEQAEVTRIAGGRVVRWDDNEDWVLIRVDTELQPPLVWLPVQSPVGSRARVVGFRSGLWDVREGTFSRAELCIADVSFYNHAGR
ncbi:hypothetical protein PsorP6_015950 [Peronosclerospora sorghi]|uniref:Uncharacterized protein n=1 Tax=Peronosclerospora sorghi TaxID=230839 RepID=A0ACC0WP54_9STRA|nr:hypothetical protein PsorP6_015950 [Peronosclerospora sorghi]